jgi:hypothetical protein
VRPPYELWSGSKSWCEYELRTESDYLPAIRSLFDDQWFQGSQTLISPVDLIAEPSCPRGEWAISVRARGRTLGYLDVQRSLASDDVLKQSVESQRPKVSDRINRLNALIRQVRGVIRDA